MQLTRAAAYLVASALAAGAFVVPHVVPHHAAAASSARRGQTGAFVPATTSLAMADAAVADAEVVEEGAETFE